MTINIAIIGTDPFYNNYSRQSPSSLVEDTRKNCESLWQTYIEDGSGAYTASFTSYSHGTVSVPASALSDCTSSCPLLSKRMEDADSWLETNWTSYDSEEAIVVLDYYGGDQDTYGVAYTPSDATDAFGAGASDEKTGMVDAWFEDNYQLPAEYQTMDSPGIAYHELSHLFSATHNRISTGDYNTHSSADEATVMWSGGAEVRCYGDSSFEQAWEKQSDCNITRVHNYISSPYF